MAKKKQPVSIPSLIITIAAVLLAVAAVIFLVITVTKSNEGDRRAETDETTVDTAYYPSSELLRSAELAAPDLLTNNYRAYQYFTQGMPYEREPYGNKPEDGFYTCSNSTFKTFNEFSDFIHSIYTDSVAAKLLTDPFGNGAVYADDNGKLGISYEFIENGRTEDNGISWENGKYTFTLTSDTECDVEIILKDKDGNDVKKQTKMINENGIWKLAEMVG